MRAGRESVLFETAARRETVVKAAADWHDLLSRLFPDLVAALKARATREEWGAGSAARPRPTSWRGHNSLGQGRPKSAWPEGGMGVVRPPRRAGADPNNRRTAA